MRKMIPVLFLLIIAVNVFAQSGVIKELSGTVELRTVQAAAYIPAKAGDLVSGDTAISTGFKSNALIEVGSAVILVRPLTRLTLTEIQSSAGTETIGVNLRAGRVRVDVNPPAGTRSSLSVVTPIATASVRGTSFEMDTAGLYVISGVVGYQGSRGALVNVRSGFESEVMSKWRHTNPYGNLRAGFPPMAPIGYDPLSAPFSSAGVGLSVSGSEAPTPPVPPDGPDEGDLGGIEIVGW